MGREVFIIHGHDQEALAEMRKFLDSLELYHLSFDDAAVEVGASPHFEDVLSYGMREVAAVIALLTPDECASVYKPGVPAATVRAAQTGWQSRPNVIFETGMAFGLARNKLIIATTGDVRTVSDLGGIQYVDLLRPDARRLLAARLVELIPALGRRLGERGYPKGDFAAIARARWQPFDELDSMLEEFSHQRVGAERRRTLLEVVSAMAKSAPGRYSIRSKPVDFIRDIHAAFKEERHLAADSFWWLMVLGFFRPVHVDNIVDDETWQGCASVCKFTDRGLALLERLASHH